jgi:hypothetical protein
MIPGAIKFVKLGCVLPYIGSSICNVSSWNARIKLKYDT